MLPAAGSSWKSLAKALWQVAWSIWMPAALTIWLNKTFKFLSMLIIGQYPAGFLVLVKLLEFLFTSNLIDYHSTIILSWCSTWCCLLLTWHCLFERPFQNLIRLWLQQKWNDIRPVSFLLPYSGKQYMCLNANFVPLLAPKRDFRKHRWWT